MTSQLIAFWIFAALAFGAVLAFLLVVRSTRKPKEIPYETVARIRKKLFVVFVVAAVIFLGLTLPLMPYPGVDGKPDQVVHVRARQFFFEFSTLAFSDDGPAAPLLEPVRVGELIEYRVISADTTHGFGIYDPEGNLISQVQAMPGYVNRLRVRFPKPGAYAVLCLEYCGPAHHGMRSLIEVAAP